MVELLKRVRRLFGTAHERAIKRMRPLVIAINDREETIAARQVYHRAKYLHDGSWPQWDHCSRCWSICEAIWANNDGGGIDMRLACGENWTDVFARAPEPQHLAFELPGEAQERAGREYARRDRRLETMP